ncbi:MAG: sugar (pentulose or hexulose) kinase [Saprospiraceae bacterium]|jgi:sugar (pentulose or hexulose) kinase
MKTKVTAIFDIGKTNKKFFLFDKHFREVYREYRIFEEIQDEDGFPCEDIAALEKWIIEILNKILKNKKYRVKALNFSSYGASLVHLDSQGKVLTPLYNYLKPLAPELITSFYKKYGPEDEFSSKTGSPNSGMLNSGMQLYWLKHSNPGVFKKIRFSLHLPQYLSYIFTGIPLSEFTSIGCHTALWDYKKKDYHDWVYKENIHKILAPIVSTETSINTKWNEKNIKIGAGIHDSSAALLPYLKSVKNPFLLVSTGTWSITLNPFPNRTATKNDLGENYLNYMRIDGKPIKASRLFLGNEYQLQVQKLASHFKVTEDYHKTVRFDIAIYLKIGKNFSHIFKWESIAAKNEATAIKIPYLSFEEAYHHLMIELVMLQIESMQTAQGKSMIKTVFVDGGFAGNEIFVKLLAHSLRNIKIKTADSSMGAALGAAICVSDIKLNAQFLKKNYSLKKQKPFPLT